METVDKVWLAGGIVWLLLAVVFIAMKLFKIVAWSWGVTLLPVIAFVALLVVVVLVVFVFGYNGPQ